MNNEIRTLQALLDDVSGNQFLGDARRMSSYLKSMSQLADAMARQCWQQFELDVIEELAEMNGKRKIKGLEAKARLAERERELAQLGVRLADFLAQADSGCFFSREDAAAALRALADDVENAEESLLFPEPPGQDEVKQFCERIGAEYAECSSADELLQQVREHARRLKTAGARAS